MPLIPAAQSALATIAALKEFNERRAAEKPHAAPHKDTQEPVEGGEIDVEQGSARKNDRTTPMGD